MRRVRPHRRGSTVGGARSGLSPTQAPMACPPSPLGTPCPGLFSGRTNMIYELRIYECVPGRLPDLNKRFSTITLKLWEKHGIKQAGFWTTVIGESNQTLYYMLAWESLAEREKKWNAFGVDPEWLIARA